MLIRNNLILNKKRGFISIFAIFFSAIITSILLALFVLLMKQIQLLSIDSSSFQAYYVADSTFECALFTEKINNEVSYANQEYAYNTTPFRASNWSNFTKCSSPGDIIAISSEDNGAQAKSVFKYIMNIGDSKYCGQAVINRNLTDSNSLNTMSITGRSEECSVTSGKVIERAIDFVY